MFKHQINQGDIYNLTILSELETEGIIFDPISTVCFSYRLLSPKQQQLPRSLFGDYY